MSKANAKKDRAKDLKEIKIPVSIFRDRQLAVLEALVEYLKEKLSLSYHEIGILTNRNERTIWTVYNRAKKKRGIANE